MVNLIIMPGKLSNRTGEKESSFSFFLFLKWSSD